MTEGLKSLEAPREASESPESASETSGSSSYPSGSGEALLACPLLRATVDPNPVATPSGAGLLAGEEKYFASETTRKLTFVPTMYGILLYNSCTSDLA